MSSEIQNSVNLGLELFLMLLKDVRFGLRSVDARESLAIYFKSFLMRPFMAFLKRLKVLCQIISLVFSEEMLHFVHSQQFRHLWDVRQQTLKPKRDIIVPLK